MQILLVEDNLRLQELIDQALRGAGYRVDAASTVAELLAAAAAVPYDLLIVDLMLPDGDGLDAIRALRARRSSVPILIMTARGSIDDRVRGLDAGADDYLIKPINQAELLAHVRALLRRPAEVMGPILRTGNIEFDEASAEVRCSGNPVRLRLRERRLLALLMRRSGFLVSKNMIEEALSEFGREISANAIEALISRIRRALTDVQADVIIETVRGVGYRLTATKAD
jgi:two-component system response regulator QseB/two-component system response regulator TctD